MPATPENIPERESMEVDALIVGAGPAGLSAACKLMQLARAQSREITVVVLEKGSEVGAHILSGAVFEPRALEELFPDWKNLGAPLETKVTADRVCFFTGAEKVINMPHWTVPKPMRNRGNYIISLGAFCQWLGAQAEQLGVEIFPGFAAGEILYDAGGGIRGVATGEMGRDVNGARKNNYEPGMEIHARVTLFAEGCRGHLGKQLIEKFKLDAGKQTQHYAIGIKELWRVDADKHQPGLVVHGAGWPLVEHGASGGSFLYHFGENLISTGLITDLNYRNPHLSPFDEFQRMKHHPVFRETLQGGERIAYGARAITKGGLHALPRMTLPNALLIGCDAGTLNFAKIKGSHTAMKCGMLAAESAFAMLSGETPLENFSQHFRKSWLHRELRSSRNFGGALHTFGVWFGGAYNFLDQNIFGGRLPFHIKDARADHESFLPAAKCAEIHYPKPDGALSFDKNSSVFLSGTNHEEDQPAHLQLARAGDALNINWKHYAGPEARFCPAGVYEFVKASEIDARPEFRINAQNCVHCKTCDIKDPGGNITWVAPEGGGGPNYTGM